MRVRNLYRVLLSLGVSVSVFAGTQKGTGNFNTEIYTEQGYLSQDDSLISSLRVRELMPLGLNVKPFLQLGSEGTSFFYFGPGVSWGFSHITTLLEWRERAFYKIVSDEPNRDLRASLIYNQQWFYQFAKSWSTYQEIYTEAVLTSAEDNNALVSGWLRSGIRQSRLSPVVIDLFLEPFASTDTLGRVYNRRVELRPSVRALYSLSKLYFGITGSYVIPISGKMDSQGQWIDRGAGLRVLAILGGEV